MEKDKEVQLLVKRLAEFLGLELVKKSTFGFKYLVIRNKCWKEKLVWIRGSPAQFNSWKDALCKFLGAECFMVYLGLEDGVDMPEILHIDNPFFEMTPEEANLRLDLLAPEKERR